MVKIWQTNCVMIMTVYQAKVNKHITDKTSEIVKKKKKTLIKQRGIKRKASERSLLLILPLRNPTFSSQ